MNSLIIECNEFLRQSGFEYAFCGGYALDLYLGKATRLHGDIDVSVYWKDRNKIINFMMSEGWMVYEALGGGEIHLIKDVCEQKLKKRNIFCVKAGCAFFKAKFIGDNIYQHEIEHTEQKNFDYIEFLFNERTDSEFIYARNEKIRRKLSKAILYKNNMPYFAPELVLLYKSTDLTRAENRSDFANVIQVLPEENKKWLISALAEAFPNRHEWTERLKQTI